MIYLDHHAATPVDPRVIAAVAAAMTELPGNASSTDHPYGDRAARAVRDAASQVAALVGAEAREVVFTSGATEALNLALRGSIDRLGPERVTLAVATTEHPAVLETCRELARAGRAQVAWLQLDGLGQVELDAAAAALRDGARVLVAMAANNEIGTIAPVTALAAMAAEAGAQFVCDAAQAGGRVPLTLEGDMLIALSAHKLYGPPGVGALIVPRDLPLAPQLTGGGQQRGIRPGSLNVPGIVGFGEACRLRTLEGTADEVAIGLRRDSLQAMLLDALPGLRVNGDQSSRLAGNLHVSLPDVPNDAVIARIRDRLAISTGSACASGTPGASHVLRAIGLPEDHQAGAFRFGLGKGTTDEEIEAAAACFIDAVNAVRRALAKAR